LQPTTSIIGLRTDARRTHARRIFARWT
jgi:hypothetical protein